MPKKKKIVPIKQQKEKPDFKIYGVRKEEDFVKFDRDLPAPLESLMNKNGGCLALFAPPGSGKGNLISNLVLRKDFLRDLFTGGTYFISPTAKNDLTNVHLCDYMDYVDEQYSDALMETIFSNIMNMDNEDREPSLCILDDCLGSIRQNSFMNRMTSTVRHLKMLLIYSLQACKGLPPTVRSNISATITFYQPSQKQLNDTVELHSMMGGETNFLKHYNDATAKKYGFLWSDFRAMKMYAWGADLPEPIEVWSMFDDAGNRIQNTTINRHGKVKEVANTSDINPIPQQSK
tara:strand:- start:112 stop:981 length:870 start_codon:yes stop_codon:yes gene_type:complete